MKKNLNKNIKSPLLREPKAKTKFGLKIKPIAMPHDDLIKPENAPPLELVPSVEDKNSLPSQSSQSSQTRHSSQTRQTPPIAPERDYQKVANSISKAAVPSGFFKGKSKQLYDALYSLTRGAIKPVRAMRVTKSKLMKLANIGSRITFDSNIRHLQSVGLIVETVYPGEHEGNEFEVFLPEESLPSQTTQTTQTSPAQKLDRLLTLETRQTSQSSKPVNADVSSTPKTSFKDSFKPDDEKTEILDKFLDKFEEAAKKITGKNLSKYENEKWGNLADLLILELEIAAKRTGQISSVPAFLTEVLRRKLFSGREVFSPIKPEKRKPDIVGTPEAEEFGINPLDDAGREKALAELFDFKDDDFLADFQKWYTNEDWQWLIEKLKVEDVKDS